VLFCLSIALTNLFLFYRASKRLKTIATKRIDEGSLFDFWNLLRNDLYYIYLCSFTACFEAGLCDVFVVAVVVGIVKRINFVNYLFQKNKSLFVYELSFVVFIGHLSSEKIKILHRANKSSLINSL